MPSSQFSLYKLYNGNPSIHSIEEQSTSLFVFGQVAKPAISSGTAATPKIVASFLNQKLMSFISEVENVRWRLTERF